MDPCPRFFRSPVSAGRASFRAVARVCVLLLALALLGASQALLGRYLEHLGPFSAVLGRNKREPDT